MDNAAWLHVQPTWPDGDEAALVRVAKSDPDAFGELCLRYSGRVYGYFRLRTQTSEEAADLTQQVFMKAFEALPRYRERGIPFGGWLFRIARNLLSDSYRRRRDVVSWDLLPDTMRPATVVDVDAALLQQEDRERVYSLLNDLPADRRELVLLRFAAGLTLREIAAVVGKSEPTIHKQLKRTLRTLQEQYHDDE